ncbi:MAG: aminodeoxychorismate synthase component I [Xanthomonadales bacterium]|nr:aminodeoxychorismate synthase component I [Xanthomonadales bacterium]
MPDLQAVARRFPDRYPYLLDSVAQGPLGRHSLLLRATGECLQLDADGRLHGPGKAPTFLGRLADWYAQLAIAPDPDQALPFAGGWFLYMGYELAAEIEPVLDLPPASSALPVALAARCDGAVLIDHAAAGSAWLVAESPRTLEAMRADLAASATEPAEAGDAAAVRCITPDPDGDFTAAVERVKEYLAAGDVFQVNLSRGWQIELEQPADPLELYRRLRRSNPAPFAGLMQWRGHALMSSSPERLVEVRGRLVQTRPIAGTYPRGGDEESDRMLSRDLLAHPKERAEHIMLIDLERNDLGRVCETGSVEVSELMVVESYAHVHHIVSNVRGILKQDAGPCDVIAAVFPGGTITGCPKVRCMQIIAELEGKGRGFYTGAMGYLGRDGQMDLNILIRSLLLSGAEVSLRTGAGIVADSVPEKELAETVAKVRGLLLALEPAND